MFYSVSIDLVVLLMSTIINLLLTRSGSSKYVFIV